ncbi:hypothetical protein L2E82_22557 [Cichorium intybus]|uniref:Uncharacterized protein n=1 Tax=Cichorium intybus TaxID=13427 RepID=A0ACB9DY39_CICIN|nr:hypothetical protein L2E82_22557 [Cichorium intybus]
MWPVPSSSTPSVAAPSSSFVLIDSNSLSKVDLKASEYDKWLPEEKQVAAPNMVMVVLDTVLSHLWATARNLRIADSPDEVHLGTIGKLELKRAKL